MYISQKRIHRIAATAFHGEPPTPEHIVDHIDTNRQNNRPENLRWLTRLENALSNPITRKRIVAICGSIESFIEDPSILGRSNLDPNLQWMRTVTPMEAQACRKRLEEWTKSDKPLSGGSLGEWVFKPLKTPNQEEKETLKSYEPLPGGYLEEWNSQAFKNPNQEEPALVMAQTPGAAQREWKIPSEFPCCPHEAEEEPIAAYAENLKIGFIFACNDLSETAVVSIAIADDHQSLWVMCEQLKENAIKPWSVAQVTFEDGLYIHTSLRNFFVKEGAEKQFCLAQGLEWTGGDTFDDYC